MYMKKGEFNNKVSFVLFKCLHQFLLISLEVNKKADYVQMRIVQEFTK